MTTRRGCLSIHRREAQLVTVATGHLEAGHAPVFTVEADLMIERRGRIFIFNDWEAMNGYDAVVRRTWTSWATRRVRTMSKIHFLATDRTVRLGVTVAAAALSLVGIELVMHSARAEFEQQVSRW